ncbi:MAG TPA: hypothetical protein VF665_16355 [Longimicrobium sp.]|uniref:hypothetical protein n=1 Tax=Longimicrobium sp. TaxID=2029185 RepID=UPI002EDAC722
MRLLSASLAALLAAAPLQAQHHDHAAGAPSAAYGHIRFPTSAAPEANAAFTRGVLYLHNFHYPQARAAFREAVRLDPGDAMSRWGEAMSFNWPVWNTQFADSARAALRAYAPTREERLARARTPRERLYLETVEALFAEEGSKAARDTAHLRAMERLAAAHPDDPEATAFLALALLGIRQGDRDEAAYARAADLSDAVLRGLPEHPGALHYLIHAVDDPRHAPRGLPAARAYSRVAPDAAHAQHMTSHIFVAMGMWSEVEHANEQAYRAALRIPGQPISHGTHWRVYSLLQQGRRREAAAWMDTLFTRVRRGGEPRSSVAAAAAAYVVDGEQWNAPYLQLPFDTAGMGFDASVSDFAAGYAALRRGDTDQARARLAVMAARNATPAAARGGYGETSRGNARVMEGTLRALLTHAAGDRATALAALDSAARLEESLPMAFGPPVTIKPPREAAGELLLADGRPAEARRQLELALARTPGRTPVLQALAHACTASGDHACAGRALATVRQSQARADAR